jgi:hypothetical protein
VPGAVAAQQLRGAAAARFRGGAAADEVSRRSLGAAAIVARAEPHGALLGVQAPSRHTSPRAKDAERVR